jgi:hypothetical protein
MWELGKHIIAMKDSYLVINKKQWEKYCYMHRTSPIAFKNSLQVICMPSLFFYYKSFIKCFLACNNLYGINAICKVGNIINPETIYTGC